MRCGKVELGTRTLEPGSALRGSPASASEEMTGDYCGRIAVITGVSAT